MNGKLTIEGTVRVCREKDERKKNVHKIEGQLLILNEDGARISVTGDSSILKGINPEDQVVVTLQRANKTLAEATEKKT